MGRHELGAVITLSGRVDNSFGLLGESLTNLGYGIDNISEKLINFGMESLDDYIQYDDLMRETKAVGEFTNAEIKMLDELNSRIVRDPKNIFSNEQLAQAEVIMGQYGMTIEQITDMLPDVLSLAMAGNLEMSDSIDYLYSSLMSLGEGVDYADELVDQMAKTAAIGATDVDTLGESLTRLGSGARLFAGGSEEIFAILTGMSKFGEDQRGSQGGTWLRNFMLSLTAPTSGIEDMVDAMEQLGVAQEEIDAYAESHSSGAAVMAIQTLEEQGLRIFNEQGKLLPAIDIIKSLRNAVYGNSEYNTDLGELTGMLDAAGESVDAFITSTEGLTDNALYTLLARIFGKRGITTALNLISISDEEWAQYMGEIANSEGFAEAMADTLQGGLGGSRRSLEATISEVKKLVGESLSDEATWWTDGFNELLVNVTEMDETKLDALVGGLTGIAAAGPALLVAGGAARLIGMMATPGGWIAAGVVLFSALAGGLKAFNEASFEANFGHLELEMTELAPYLDSIGDDFREAYSEAEAFGDAVTTAAENYDAAAQTFATDLLTSTLTGKTLTEEEQKALFDLGDNMMTQIKTGITNGLGESTYWLEALFGGEEVAGVGDSMEDSMYRQMVLALDNYYSDLKAKAYGVGKNLRDDMTKAFEDGVLDATEYKRIMDHYNNLNAIMSEVEDFERRSELEAERRKASAVTEDSFSGYMEELENRKASELDAWWDEYYQQYGKQKTALDLGLEWAGIDPTTGQVVDKERNARVNAGLDPETGEVWTDAQRLEYVQNGWINDKTGQVINVNERDRLLELFDSKWQEAADLLAGGYDEAAAIAVDSMLTQTDFGKAWNFMSSAIPALLQNGQVQRDEQGALDLSGISWAWLDAEGYLDMTNAGELSKLFQQYDYFYEKLAPFEEIPEVANLLSYLEYAQAMATGWQQYEQRKRDYELSGGTEDPYNEFSTPEELALRQQLADEQAVLNQKRAEQAQIDADIAAAQDRMAGKNRPIWYDLTSGYATDHMSLYGNVLGGNLTERKQQIDLDVAESEAKVADLQEQIDALEATVEVPDGAEDANGYITGFQGTLDANPGTWDVNVKFNTGNMLGAAGRLIASTFGGFFADGGRATEASIFGEVPGQAEWAIPEAHTQRTADLLDSAREASGFTWPELIERTGGLNANPHHTPMKVVYAPVIHAADARGVEQKLQEDKERFIKWMKEYETEKEMASYG